MATAEVIAVAMAEASAEATAVVAGAAEEGESAADREVDVPNTITPHRARTRRRVGCNATLGNRGPDIRVRIY